MDDKFKRAVWMSIAVVAVLALIDIWAKNSGLFIDYYTGGTAQKMWWFLYQDIGTVILVLLPLAYYFLVKKDFSESLALYLNSWILWSFGLEDVLYYWLQRIPVDSCLPWLNNSFFIQKVSSIVGYPSVTSTGLYASVAVGLVLVYLVSKEMYKVN